MEKSFFENFKEVFEEIKEHVLVQGYTKSEARKFALLLLNRLIIIYFVQNIYWINYDKNYILHYLNKYKESSKDNSFYDKWLAELFFDETAYGAVFEKNNIDNLKIELPDDLIIKIIEEFLEKYNFNISEGSILDLETSINPKMLGIIYESFIAEEERGKSGIFYTPRRQVDLMCRLAILEFLLTDKYNPLPNANMKEKLGNFVFSPLNKWTIEKKNELKTIKKALDDVKIVDPACGSGAFLVGMFNILLELYQKLDIEINLELKQKILRNSLYGVDVKDWAVRIAKIRLWLMIITNEDMNSKEMPILCNFPFNLHSGDSLLRSTWELNYPEIVFNGSFDIIITNPPYIRQEDIAKNYKNMLISQVSDRFNLKISKKSDYYVYFFLKSIELASEKGVIALLSSNSWLDVQFGSQLRQGLLKNAHIEAIIENLSRRAFESADINTIITILKKKTPEEQFSGNIRFISFFELYEDIPYYRIFKDILTGKNDEKAETIQLFNCTIRFRRETDHRILTIPGRDLWELETKWSKFLKAPEIYFTILEKYKDIFVPLGEITTFTYGEKTGANDFFFLGKPGAPHKYFISKYDAISGDLKLYLKNDKNLEIFKDFLVSKEEPVFTTEKEYWMHVLEPSNENVKEKYEYINEESNNITWVPNYLIKSPKELNSIIVPPKELKKIYLHIPPEESLLKDGIKKYINWGESMEYHSRPSCNRTPWYSLNLSAYEDIICVELIHDRYFFAHNKYNLLYDHTNYGFSFEEGSELNGAILNSTLTALFMEFEGRTTYGDGALGLMQYEYESLLTIKPEIVAQLGKKDKDCLRSYFNGGKNPTIDSIFVEIGTSNPNEVNLDEIKPSRRKVDKIVFEKILQLSEEEQSEIYKSIITLVKRRLEKAKGIENRFH